MTDLREELESTLQRAKDVRPRLGLAGAIIGEPVKVRPQCFIFSLGNGIFNWRRRYVCTLHAMMPSL